MKITKRHLRRIIEEEIDPRLKGTHYDPRYQEGPPGGWDAYVAAGEAEAAERERSSKYDQKTLDFINPTQQHVQKYLDQAQKLNLTVVENTPELLLVQGLEDDLVEFDAYFNEVEDPQVANSFYKTASKKDIRQNVALAMKPVTEITRRRLRRIIKEAIEQGETITYRGGDTFAASRTRAPGPKRLSKPGLFKDTIVMSPNGDSVLIGGEETDMSMLDIRLYELTGQQLGTALDDKLMRMVMKQVADGYVEIPISYTPEQGWSF